jgi:hypothetical protein
LHGGVDRERIGDVDECCGVGAEDEAGAGYGPGCVVLFGPGGEGVFLREVEVRVWDAVCGCVFRVWDGGGTDVKGIVLSAGLEEEAFGDYVGDGEG